MVLLQARTMGWNRSGVRIAHRRTCRREQAAEDKRSVSNMTSAMKTESAVMFAGLRGLLGLLGHPDVAIAFSTMAGTGPGSGLLERNKTATQREPLYMRLAFTRLQERQRSINGLTGEELLLRVRETNVTTGYEFQWEMAGRGENIFAPLLTLELESGVHAVNGGKPVQSSLFQDAMLDVWERISSSIRLRPTELSHSAATAR